MIKKSLPEQLLLDFLSSYSHLLRADVVKFMVEDIDHNECGLAYDALIFEMQHKYLVADKIILADH